MGCGPDMTAAAVAARPCPGGTSGSSGAGCSARGAGPVGDPGGLPRDVGPAALSSGAADGAAAVRLQLRRLCVAPYNQGLRGAPGLPGGERAAAAGLSHHQRFPQASSRGAGGLFDEVLLLGRKAGHVAPDGTWIKDHAPKHKAIRDGRMVRPEAAPEAEIAAWLERAAQADAAEDGTRGADRRGDDMLSGVTDTSQRLARIRGGAKVAAGGGANTVTGPNPEFPTLPHQPAVRTAIRSLSGIAP